MIVLCGFPLSNYYNKVKMALLEKGVPFTEEIVATGSKDEAVLAATGAGRTEPDTGSDTQPNCQAVTASVGDAVRLQQRHVAVELQMELDELVHAGGTRPQVVHRLHRRMRGDDRADLLADVVRELAIHQVVQRDAGDAPGGIDQVDRNRDRQHGIEQEALGVLEVLVEHVRDVLGREFH